MDRLKGKVAGIPLWIVVIGFIAFVVIPVVNTIIYAFSMGWYYPHLLPPRYTGRWFVRTFTIWRLHETLLNTAPTLTS